MPGQTDSGRVVRELYAALNAQDRGAFDQIVSEQVEYVDYGLNETVRGREAFKDHFENWWTAFPKGTGEVRNLIESGRQVLVEALGRGEQSGPFETDRGAIEPTNRLFEFHFCQVFEIKDGVIASGRTYSDAFKLLAGLPAASKAA